jgi:hypothetical protein
VGQPILAVLISVHPKEGGQLVGAPELSSGERALQARRIHLSGRADNVYQALGSLL